MLVLRIFADMGSELVAVHSGKADVQEDEFRLRLFDLFETGDTVKSDFDMMAVDLQELASPRARSTLSSTISTRATRLPAGRGFIFQSVV